MTLVCVSELDLSHPDTAYLPAPSGPDDNKISLYGLVERHLTTHLV